MVLYPLRLGKSDSHSAFRIVDLSRNTSTLVTHRVYKFLPVILRLTPGSIRPQSATSFQVRDAALAVSWERCTRLPISTAGVSSWRDRNSLSMRAGRHLTPARTP